MIPKHLTVETLARIALRRITERRLSELLPRGANDRAVAVPDHDVETQIGGVHFGHLYVDALAQGIDRPEVEAGVSAVIGEDVANHRRELT